jgi:hypothetical protein
MPHIPLFTGGGAPSPAVEDDALLLSTVWPVAWHKFVVTGADVEAITARKITQHHYGLTGQRYGSFADKGTIVVVDDYGLFYVPRMNW